MAVTGFDDIAMAQYLSPPLTTVHVDAYGMGERAVRLSMRSLAGEASVEPSHEVLPTRLVVRHSCGATRARDADTRGTKPRTHSVTDRTVVSTTAPPRRRVASDRTVAKPHSRLAI